MKVWVYPERTYEELGEERWEVSWEALKKSVQGKDDIDPDADIDYIHLAFKTKTAAMERARKAVDDYETAFGQVTVTRQVVDWYVKEDSIAEWRDTDEIEYVD